jgi:membrane protease YdiL (CAAX protease family)
MRTLTTSRAGSRARQARNTPAAHGLARSGLAARGVIYILIGWVALLVALGHGSHEADQQGALQMLAGKPYGSVSLWLLGFGFAAYALWRLSEAAFGVAGDGRRAGPRLRSLARAVIYGFLAYLTFQVLSGTQGSQSGQQQDVTAKVMQHPGGRWLVGIAGVVIVIAGVVLAMEGIRRKFMKYLQASQMSRRTRRVVELLGVIGTVARGVVVALVGIGVIDAAVSYNSAASGGIDKALLGLRNQPAGPVLLIIVALGLVIFGIYGLCEARWRRV